MLTPHYVVTLLDQHSSPNDPRAERRILDARDALDPFAPWDTLRRIVDRYEVTVIVLNDRFETRPRLLYWAPTPEWFAAARARLDAHPAAFERLRDTGDFVVYRLHRAALDDSLPPPPDRSYVRPWREGSTIAWRMGEGLPHLENLTLSPRVLDPGDSLHGVAQWRAPERLPAGSYTVVMRFDRALPWGLDPPALVSKPVRKVIEKWRGEMYRLRADHAPVGGVYGVDAWLPTEVVLDSFALVIPPNAAPGEYDVRISMVRQPEFHNHEIRDYLNDDDMYSGLKRGSIRVRGDGGERSGEGSGVGH
jgi:hypothetical protein